MTTLLALPDRMRRRTAVLLGALLLAVGVLAGCAGGGDSAAGGGGTADRSSSGEVPGVPQAAGGRALAGGDSEESGAGSTAARALPGDRDIVYRGSITVRVRDVVAAAARAETLVEGVDGVVFAEQIQGMDTGRGNGSPDGRRDAGGGQAQLTLRVPPSQFAATLDALGRLGREIDRSRSARDVTTELADTSSRVRSQQRSVERVRALLAQADTIGEVVQVEAELARREADLESLQAQLARLADVTDLATIEATFVSRHTDVSPPEDGEDLGFLSGLRSGWDAMLAVLLLALTVLGAVLPFAVAAAVVGLPAYVLVRRSRRPANQPTPTG